MIDRERRDALAQLLRQFAAGLMTTDQFEDRVYASRDNRDDLQDRVLYAVPEAAWFLYHDLWAYRLKGRAALPKGERREVARWIAFLYSAREYEWPIESLVYDPAAPGCLKNILTLGRASRHWQESEERRLTVTGTWDLWPFIRRADYEATVSEPRLLGGAA